MPNTTHRLRRPLSRILLAFALVAASPLCSAFCWEPLPYTYWCSGPSATVAVYEYRNQFTERRVFLNDPTELAYIGSVPESGWRRTALALTMPVIDYRGGLNTLYDVCRFYAPSVNSHFFAGFFECDLLKKPGTGWTYERVAFKYDPPRDGICPKLSPVPIYRYYNNREVTHRYSPDRSLKARLESEGWVDEGIALCAVNAGYAPAGGYQVLIAGAWDEMGCEFGGAGKFGCVALTNLAPLSRGLSYDEAGCSNYRSPYGPNTPFIRQTGGYCSGVSTAQMTGALDQIDTHTFILRNGSAIGIYLNGRDALLPGGTVRIEPLRTFVTTAPAGATAEDVRFMPWRSVVPVELDISFKTTLKRVNVGVGGKVAAYPMVEFFDTVSQQSFVLDIGAIASEAQAELTRRDPETYEIVVFTTFRSQPAFGETIAGDTVVCDQSDNIEAACKQGDNTKFLFRLRQSDFQAAITRARALDKRLSPKPSDYAIANMRFRTEASGDAEMGMYYEYLSANYFAR